VQLAANRRVRLERYLPEFGFETFASTVDCNICEPGFQFEELALLNSNVRVACAVANRISAKLDRHFPSVADELTLLFEEGVPSVGGDKHEGPLEPEVLKIGESRRFTPGPRSFSNSNAVLLDYAGIDEARIFALRNFSLHVEEVPAADVGNGELLDESGNTRCFAKVVH
jgi:hypothetical protein